MTKKDILKRMYCSGFLFHLVPSIVIIEAFTCCKFFLINEKNTSGLLDFIFFHLIYAMIVALINFYGLKALDFLFGVKKTFTIPLFLFFLFSASSFSFFEKGNTKAGIGAIIFVAIHACIIFLAADVAEKSKDYFSNRSKRKG